MSRALGVYVVLGDVALPKVPVPLVVHVPDAEFEDDSDEDDEEEDEEDEVL